MPAELSSRAVALRALREIERSGGFSNRILSDLLERNLHLDGRDRGFVTTLVYGVLRNRSRLDRMIDAFAARPKKLKGELRELLRISAFELVELGHPLHAASSEAAKQAAHLDPRGGLTSLVTAVLAGIDRDAPVLDAVMVDGKPLDALDLRWSIPRWLAGRWLKSLGAERAIARARALAQPPPVDLRVDLRRHSTAAVREQLLAESPTAEVEVLADHPQCLRTRGAGDLFHRPLHEEGTISVQALGSQRAVVVLDPQPGESVLDGCAGMGTKTLQLAESIDRRGRIVAVDPDARRLAALQDNLERGRATGGSLDTIVIEGDLCEHARDLGPFDAALIDAPCTGLGNLGRHPELRYRTRYADIGECAALQDRLIDATLPRVKPSGRVLYSVCSLEPEEGPDRVQHAISHHGWRCLREEVWTPEEHGCDGFYLALLQRP